MDIRQYLTEKSTHWLESELEQAHATASDESLPHVKREAALAASVMMADELNRRSNSELSQPPVE